MAQGVVVTDQEHTPEPWSTSTWVEQPNNRTKPMIVSGGVAVAITHPAPICRQDECEANAHRIVACVNALQGIGNPSAIADLVEAAQAVSEWDWNGLRSMPEHCDWTDALMAIGCLYEALSALNEEESSDG